MLISDGLWRRRFGGDPGVLGRTIRVGDRLWPIVGVMPAGVWTAPWMQNVDLWTPIDLRRNELTPHTRWLTAYARLRPTVTLEQAQAEMDGVCAAHGRTAIRRLQRLDTESRTARGNLCPRRRHGSLHAAGGGRIRSVDRLRQRGESIVGTRGKTAARDRRPLVAWRGTPPPVPTIADREPAARV